MKNTKTLILAMLIGALGFTANTYAQVKSEMADNNQKMNLDPVTSERFPLTDIVWPTSIGEADVCLWHQDKMAAASITIDDNIEYEHEWWLTMHWTYQLDFTWFVILNSVSSWDKYQTLIDAGNEVQGHDNCNINDYDTAAYRVELENTKLQINSNLNNNNCITYAYPCGKQDKQEIARTIYTSMRGVTGVLNNANKTDYLDLNSRSATNDVHDIRVLLDPNEKLWNNSYYRGWASYHYHSISSKKVETEQFLMALSAKKDSIWVGKYSEVARYGQERDSHTLTIDETNESSIKLTLTDEMNDVYFDFPLTVKVRIENSWDFITAYQNELEIESEIIEFENNKYALVQVVPDQGQVTISNIVNTAPEINPIGNQQVSENTSTTINIIATDAEADQINLSTNNLPAFGTLTDNGDGTGVILINPLSGDEGNYENITVNAFDGKVTSSSSFNLEVLASSSVNINSADYGLKIFPNPSENGIVYISYQGDLADKNARLDVTNKLGQQLFSMDLPNTKEQISVPLPLTQTTDLLFFRLTTSKGSTTKKVLIKNL